MPIPRAVTQLNKKYLNRAFVHLAGHGWFVGGARIHLRDELLTLGAPVDLPEDEGRSRMPQPSRLVLPLLGCHDYVEIPVRTRAPFTGW